MRPLLAVVPLAVLPLAAAPRRMAVPSTHSTSPAPSRRPDTLKEKAVIDCQASLAPPTDTLAPLNTATGAAWLPRPSASRKLLLSAVAVAVGPTLASLSTATAVPAMLTTPPAASRP